MYQICVSGAAKGASVEAAKQQAEAVGQAIAEGGHVLMTGATSGLPNYAAIAYKKAGGTLSLGISPASSKIEHIMKYRLPTEAYDVILYTGLHYTGRDLLLVSSSDAVMSIGGRLGTLHEFTVAMEQHIPIGFYENSGGVESEIHHVLKAAGEEHDGFVRFNDDARSLLGELVEELDMRKHKYYVDRSEKYINELHRELKKPHSP